MNCDATKAAQITFNVETGMEVIFAAQLAPNPYPVYPESRRMSLCKGSCRSSLRRRKYSSFQDYLVAPDGHARMSSNRTLLDNIPAPGTLITRTPADAQTDRIGGCEESVVGSKRR